MHPFTTEYPGGPKGKAKDPKLPAHNAIEYLGLYNSIAVLIYGHSNTCCELLTNFTILIDLTRNLLEELNNRGRIDPPLPAAFEMHKWDSKKPWKDTQDKFAKLRDEACKGQDKDKVPIHDSVKLRFRELREFTRSIWLDGRQLDDGPIYPTYIEFEIALAATSIFGVARAIYAKAGAAAVRGASARAAAGGAASGAARAGTSGAASKWAGAWVRTMAEMAFPK